jgi:hypothetical protein
MRILRLGTAILCVLALFTVTFTPQKTQAEENNACRALATDTIAAAIKACADMPAGSACMGHADVKTADTPMAKAGANMPLADLANLATSGADPAAGAWGIAMMDIATEAGNIEAVLFGDAMLSKQSAPALATLPVKTFDELPVLMRAGASQNFPQVGKLLAGKEAVVDGRNEKGTWVRVRMDNVVGWAWINQVTVTGDVMSLAVLNDQDIAPLFLYPAPMQAFTLRTSNKTSCAEAASGLLLRADQSDAKKLVRVLVNGAEIAISKGLLLVSALEKDNLEVMVLEGEAVVTSFATERPLTAGQMARLRLGGKDGLTVIAAPRPAETFGFSVLEGAPVNVAVENFACVAGVAVGDARTAVRSGPGKKEYTSLFFAQPNAIYYVEGFNNDSENNRWLKLKGDKTAENWVEASTVRMAGKCDSLAKVEPGTFDSAGGVDSGIPGGGGFAPAARTIWNVEVGVDQRQGVCNNPGFNYCNHMAAVSPRGSGLSWKGQELNALPMRKTAENTYFYAGRNGLGDGKLTLAIVFTSPTTFTGTQTVIYDNEPGCKHVYTINGVIR